MIDESWYIRPPDCEARRAAGGIVVRVEDGRIWVALVREADYDDYVLPKGHLEIGETVLEGALREIEEESGLGKLTFVTELGIRERLDYRKTHWKTTHYFLFATTQQEGIPLDRKQHPHPVSWFPIDELPRRDILGP